MTNLTNASVSVYRRTKNWKGQISEALVGTYSVWKEDREIVSRMVAHIGGSMDIKEVEKGILFFYDDIDFTDCYVKMGDEAFEIVAVDRYVDEKEEFYHAEVLYR